MLQMTSLKQQTIKIDIKSKTQSEEFNGVRPVNIRANYNSGISSGLLP